MNYAQQLINLKPQGEAFVAFIDILGFSNFVLNNSHFEVIKQYQCKIRALIDISLAESAAQISGRSPWRKTDNGDLEPDMRDVSINCFSASDSIIFWASNNSTADLIKLMVTVRNLMAKLIHFGFPPRGAITHGTFTFDGGYISAGSQIMHLQIFGKPFVEAVALEKNQNWSGCMIHPSIIRKYDEASLSIFEQKSIISKYKIPLKKYDLSNEPLYAINWCRGITEADRNKINPTSIRASFNEYKKCDNVDPDKVEEMIKNTIEFFEEMQPLPTEQ